MPLTLALATTAAAIGISVGIKQIIGMTTRTMRFRRIFSGWGHASECIDATGNKFEMIGRNAESNAAKMIPLKAFRHWPCKDMMSVNIFTFGAEEPIAAGLSTQPDITAIRPTGIDFSPEAFKKWAPGILAWHREPSFLGVMRQAVNAVLPPSFYRRCDDYA